MTMSLTREWVTDLEEPATDLRFHESAGVLTANIDEG
jgi:hypothetical protein